MEELMQFIGGKTPFFVATEEEGQPRVRPFGFAMEYEGRLYFCTSNQKAVYRQLQKNPLLELCAMTQAGRWLRLGGEAVFDDSAPPRQKAFDVSPELARLYRSPQNPAFAMFYLKEIKAVVYSFTEPPRELLVREPGR